MNTKYLEIIKAPVVTEKSTNGKNLNQYTFKVSPVSVIILPTICSVKL